MYYRPDCKDCVKEKALIWAEGNRDKWLAKCIRYNNKPEVKPKQNEAKKAHRESGKYRVWQQSNPDKIKKNNENYSNKKHDVSLKEWDACRLYFNYRCAYCGVTYEEHKETQNQDLHKEHVDHLGSNKIDNCVPSCRSCNSGKGKKEMEVWYETKYFYQELRVQKIYKWILEDFKKLQ